MRDDTGKEAIALMVLGAAAGALATYLVQTIASEKSAVGAMPTGSVNDWIRGATQKLQAGRDKIVEAIEKSNPS